jgi:hypothetical protein
VKLGNHATSDDRKSNCHSDPPFPKMSMLPDTTKAYHRHQQRDSLAPLPRLILGKRKPALYHNRINVRTQLASAHEGRSIVTNSPPLPSLESLGEFLPFERLMILRGPNYWSRRPCMEVWVDLGPLNDFSSELIP